MSTTTEPFSEGTPMAKGLVPKMASVAPCGVTYSGDWESTTPIMPLSARCFAQYLYRIPMGSITQRLRGGANVWGMSGGIALQIQIMVQHWSGINRMHDFLVDK